MQLETLIGRNTLGILYFPADYERPREGLLALWRRHLIANAAVRDREYMVALFSSHFPNCRLVTLTSETIPVQEIESAGNVVFLFPDSIGLDFGIIERSIASQWPTKRMFALNGRRRFFRLDASMRRRIAVRRLLEKSRIPEAGLLVVFMVATPFLMLIDLARGRR